MSSVIASFLPININGTINDMEITNSIVFTLKDTLIISVVMLPENIHTNNLFNSKLIIEPRKQVKNVIQTPCRYVYSFALFIFLRKSLIAQKDTTEKAINFKTSTVKSLLAICEDKRNNSTKEAMTPDKIVYFSIILFNL